MAIIVVEIHVPAAGDGAWIEDVEDLLADLEDNGDVEVYDDAERVGDAHVFYLTGKRSQDLLAIAARVAGRPDVPQGAFAIVTDDKSAHGTGRRVPLTGPEPLTGAEPLTGPEPFTDQVPLRDRVPGAGDGGRILIGLLMTAALLLGITAVVDRVAAHFAEKAITLRLSSALATKTQPSVTITGWPFLTQLVAHRLDEVDVAAVDFRAKGVAFARVDLALHDAWRTNTTITATRIAATVELAVAELQRLAGNRLAITTARDGLHVAGTVAGQKVSGTAAISVVAGKLHLVPRISSPASASLPAIDVQIPPLPWGVVVTGVAVTETGLKLLGTAHDVDLMKP